MTVPYHEFTEYLKKRFTTFKVQKISLDAGFTCPNRDGSKGRGGCTYCNNKTFNPEYCDKTKSITEQLHEGIRFFSYKYPEMRYLAYFQAYSNTYADMETLRERYEEALSVEGVEGLIIGTRPDCVSDEILDYLQNLSCNTFVMVEYGVESIYDETLRRINRCHTYADSESAIRKTAARNIPVGAHLILGMPGETREQILSAASKISLLPLTSIKLHQMQIIRGTKMAKEYEEHPERFHIFTADEYIELVIEFISRLRKDIYIDRFVSQSPKEMLLAPDWGLKNYEFAAKLQKALQKQIASGVRL